MIGRLLGALISDELEGLALVDVGGVGYEVLTPPGSLARARTGDGSQVLLHVHTHVREEAFDLYGFPTELEKRVFRLLINVPNVGPKTALGVLAELPPQELSVAVQRGDVGRLNKVSGIGKKTAERLVLELKGKLPELSGVDLTPAPGAVTAQKTPSAQRERLLGALTNMGYRPVEAERAVDGLGPRITDMPLQEALKEALAQLAR